MTRPVRLGLDAAAELADAARWYEDMRPGLGAMFLDAVDVTVESIAQWPGAGTSVEGLAKGLDVRRAPVGRFPYHVAILDFLRSRWNRLVSRRSQCEPRLRQGWAGVRCELADALCEPGGRGAVLICRRVHEAGHGTSSG